jgi:hypothetical protein
MARLTSSMRIRSLAFIVIGGFMIFGPAYRQILRPAGVNLGVDVRTFRSWQMFNQYGKDVCDVRFYSHRPNGRVVPLDRFERLGYESARSAPKAVRLLRDESAVRRMGDRLCKSQPKKSLDVRVQARCGHSVGWVTTFAQEDNLCENSRRKRGAKKGKKHKKDSKGARLKKGGRQ